MVKLFMWKAGNDLLATRNNLFHREIVKNPMCPIFLSENEAIIHISWQCPTSTNAWAENGSLVQKWERAEEDFMSL